MQISLILHCLVMFGITHPNKSEKPQDYLQLTKLILLLAALHAKHLALPVQEEDSTISEVGHSFAIWSLLKNCSRDMLYWKMFAVFCLRLYHIAHILSEMKKIHLILMSNLVGHCF